MPGTPQSQPPELHLDAVHLDAVHLDAVHLDVVREEVVHDEVAAKRRRHAGAGPRPLPGQRDPGAPLTDPEREQYEQQLDAYAVQVQEYRRQLQEFAEQLQLAHRDGLTGAWLRTAGERLLEQELQRAARTDMPLSIAFVDVDALKRLNDTAGHAAGDHALATVGRVLLAGLRSYDHVVRWGGDEFLCLLPGVRHDEAARRVRHVQQVLAHSADGLTISVGVAERHAGEDATALVARADAALYGSRGGHRRR